MVDVPDLGSRFAARYNGWIKPGIEHHVLRRRGRRRCADEPARGPGRVHRLHGWRRRPDEELDAYPVKVTWHSKLAFDRVESRFRFQHHQGAGREPDDPGVTTLRDAWRRSLAAEWSSPVQVAEGCQEAAAELLDLQRTALAAAQSGDMASLDGLNDGRTACAKARPCPWRSRPHRHSTVLGAYPDSEGGTDWLAALPMLGLCAENSPCRTTPCGSSC